MDETQELPMNLPAMNPTTLESLPVELRIQILKSILDFLALHRLLNASPVYRRTYGFVQGEVIFSILYHHYGCVAVDVLATVLSAKFDNIHIQRTKENVIAFLDRYRHARGAISPNTLFAHSTVEEQTLRIEGFHNIQKCLTSLVDEYLENFDSCCLSYDLGIPHDDNGRCKHSLEERMRITRGICRVQTSVNVFARLMPNSPAKWGDFEAYEIFGATFPQWEQHEIWSMFKWIDEKTWALVVIMDAQHTVLRPYGLEYLSDLFLDAGPTFYARLRHEKDDKKLAMVLDKIDSGPWTVYEPWFEFCHDFPEWIYPADELVGKYGGVTAEHASATDLQRPAPGWDRYDWCTPRDVTSFDIGLSCFALGKCK